jgi:DNA-binding transcriptional LysR family regulator
VDNLTDIAVFVRVVERGSFTRAADELELSRAVVSKYLSRLEDRLGARLLHRTTRRLSLTEAGAALFEASRGALERIVEAEDAVATLQKQPRGRLRVSAPMGFGILYLGAAVAEFLRANPGVTIDLHLDDRYVNLVAEGLDMAIRIGELTDSSLVARKLSVTQPIVVASPGYIEALGAPEAPEDLAAHNCLLYSYLSTANVWRFTAPDGREVPVAVTGTARVNNGNIECELAAAGVGLAMVPTFYAAPYLRSGRLKRVLERYRMPELGIHAVYPERTQVPPKVRAFVDFLAARFGRRPEWERP